MVTLTGPLADYMTGQTAEAKVETLPFHRLQAGGQRSCWEILRWARVAILHKTFAVTNVVDLPFEVPAHAANPQLRGTYRSFVKQRERDERRAADVNSS